jgi:nucleotide-binding universal stress UspA family protein
MSAANVPTPDPLQQPILVPLDGSEIAERALRYAALIPNRMIRLLACAPITLSAARNRWALGEVPPDGGTWLVSTPESYLELVAIPLRQQGRDVEVVVSNGKPEKCIVAAAADAEMVVMTTRGDGLTRMLVGGTAEHVVRHAPAPTLLVRDEHPVAAVAVLRIVVPLDGSNFAAEALPVAAIMRHGLGAALHLVRVVDPATSPSTADLVERDAAAHLRRELARLHDTAGMMTYEVRVGPPEEHVLTVLLPGDLVVMATRGFGELGRRLMGSVSTTVAERSPVPVVLVRAEPGQISKELLGVMGRAGRAD